MKREVTQEQMDMISDYSNTFGTDSGKRVLEDLRKEFCEQLHVPGDPYATHVRVGERGVVLKIARMIKLGKLPLDIVEELTSEI